MDMFEVRVFDHDGKMLKRSLIQAFCKDDAMPEAFNVFHNTDGANTFTIE
jgi:hypothetical protein